MVSFVRPRVVLAILVVSVALPAAAVDPDLRIYAEDFPLEPLQRVMFGINVIGTPISALTAEAYPHVAALEVGTSWDFSGLDGGDVVVQFAPVLPGWSCYVPESPDIPNLPCGFDLPENELLFVQDDLTTLARDVVALDYDDAGTFFIRAWSIDEGGTPATGDEELRLCFAPIAGREEVPFMEFGNVEPVPPFRRYMQNDGGTWNSATFNCTDENTPIVVGQNGPCGTVAETSAALSDEDGTLGQFRGRITSAGSVTLPSGHVLDALLVESLASFKAVLPAPLIGCIEDPGGAGRQHQYQLMWMVPEYGPLIQLRSASEQNPDLTTWTEAGTTVIGYGLLPPLSVMATTVGDRSIQVSWDPGALTRHIDSYEVHWDVLSGHDEVPFFSSGVLDAALGTAYTINGLAPETEYYISVTTRASYTDPVSGETTDYSSIALPESIGADVDGDGVRDLDHSYPPEIVVTTGAVGAGELLGWSSLVSFGGGVPVPPLSSVFDPLCATAGLRLCAESTEAGSLPLILVGAGTLVSPSILRYYEHTSGTEQMRVRRAGGDLALSP